MNTIMKFVPINGCGYESQLKWRPVDPRDLALKSLSHISALRPLPNAVAINDVDRVQRQHGRYPAAACIMACMWITWLAKE
jgi:hypothetical protein